MALRAESHFVGVEIRLGNLVRDMEAGLWWEHSEWNGAWDLSQEPICYEGD